MFVAILSFRHKGLERFFLMERLLESKPSMLVDYGLSWADSMWLLNHATWPCPASTCTP